MRIYRVTITADKYPTDYNVEASNWGTGIARAVKEWQKRFKGSRATEMKLRVVKSSPLLKENSQI